MFLSSMRQYEDVWKTNVKHVVSCVFTAIHLPLYFDGSSYWSREERTLFLS